MNGRDQMRAADADRELVAKRLREALDEGRLNLTEYDDRLREAYAAKTYGDLDSLLADLPDPAPARRSQVVPVSSPAAPAPAAPPRPAPASVQGWLAAMWGPWAMAVGINVVIWLLVSLSAGDLIYFWPMWVAGPWGCVLIFATLNGLGRGEPQRWAEKRERNRRRG